MSHGGADADTRLTVAVRTDLGMGRGKIAALVGRASVVALERVRTTHPAWVEAWLGPGQARVVVRAADPEDMRGLKARADSLGIPWSAVADAGRARPGRSGAACIVFGPAPAPAIDMITGNLGPLRS